QGASGHDCDVAQVRDFMSILQRLFGKGRASPEPSSAQTQAVLVHLVGYTHDLTTLEDQLIEVIEAGALGEFDGNEVRPAMTTLFMYGPDAERLFAGIESTLRASPFCRNARVVVRRGGPGADQREVRL